MNPKLKQYPHPGDEPKEPEGKEGSNVPWFEYVETHRAWRKQLMLHLLARYIDEAGKKPGPERTLHDDTLHAICILLLDYSHEHSPFE